ncbi:MAG: MerR family DNA-binding transcriptional regulator [Fibrobacteria bacterium]|nr:MerR family DNA-binding transcriptional regulator [Fibrobacteria bacterium]
MKTTNDITASNLEPQTLGIGELSRRTGIAIVRIRAWETRYGVPRPLRTDSGHRRYHADEAIRLELLAQAVRGGKRIGDIATLDIEALSALTPAGHGFGVHGHPWLEWARLGDEASLHKAMSRSFVQLGWKSFVDSMISPFLVEIGTSWEKGDLGVAQEHFASGVVRDFLQDRWRKTNRSCTGAPLLLAMLPDDQHDLGLHLCALAAVQARRRVIWMGANTPVSAILSAARSWTVSGIVTTVPITSDFETLRPFLVQIRADLPKSIPLYAGGSGWKTSFRGITTFPDLGAFHEHLLQ